MQRRAGLSIGRTMEGIGKEHSEKRRRDKYTKKMKEMNKEDKR